MIYTYIYNIVLLLHQRYEKIIQLKLLLMCAAIILMRDSKRKRERERQTAIMYIEAIICVCVKKAVLSSYFMRVCLLPKFPLANVKYDKQ